MVPTSRKGREKWGTLSGFGAGSGQDQDQSQRQKVNIKVNVGAAGIRGSHPFAENAKGWGTLFGFGAGSVKITINVKGERASRLLRHVAFFQRAFFPRLPVVENVAK